MSTLFNQSLFASQLFGPAATTSFSQLSVTGRGVIYWALRVLGVLLPGQTPSPETFQDGMLALNDMMDAWQTERLLVWAITRQEFAVTAGKQEYTVGSGGDWNVPRPARIEQASCISLQNPAQPLELPLDLPDTDQWQTDYPVKNITSTLPTALHYEPVMPQGRAELWPVPSISNIRIALYLWQQVGLFADLDTTFYAFPPGYARAIRYGLAEAMMPAFSARNKTDRQQWARVISQAAEYKGKIKALNTPAPIMQCDAALTNGAHWDYRTGEYR